MVTRQDNSMISQAQESHRTGMGLRMPPSGSEYATQALEIATEACQRLDLPLDMARISTSRGWVWDPLTPINARTTIAHFYHIDSILSEAQRIVAVRCSSEVGQEGLRATNGFLVREQRVLEQDILALLSMTENPVAVLRELLRVPGGVKPRMFSTLLGIKEESIGGDLLRHPSSQRNSVFGRGGFMYQPSDPHELWQIFSMLPLRAGATFFDLGSGYGHVLFYGAIARPDITFKGIELMSTRVAECEAARVRHGIKNLSFVAGDVTQGGFSQADIIFLFNPFPPDTLLDVCERISKVAQEKPLAVVDYGGRVTQSIPNLVPVVVRDFEPYRLVCSRKFLKESCALVGVPEPISNLRRAGR